MLAKLKESSFAKAFLIHRRRVATLIAVGGVLFIGTHLANAWPREVPIEYIVPDDTESLEIRYRLNGELIQTVKFGKALCASGRIPHQPSLAAGTYHIEAIVLREGRSQLYKRSFIAPSEEKIAIRLH